MLAHPIEDVFFCWALTKLEKKMPDAEVQASFAVEMQLQSKTPLGLHAAWKYLEPKELISVLEGVRYPGAVSLLAENARTQQLDAHQGHGAGMYDPPANATKEEEAAGVEKSAERSFGL